MHDMLTYYRWPPSSGREAFPFFLRSPHGRARAPRKVPRELTLCISRCRLPGGSEPTSRPVYGFSEEEHGWDWGCDGVWHQHIDLDSEGIEVPRRETAVPVRLRWIGGGRMRFSIGAEVVSGDAPTVRVAAEAAWHSAAALL